MTLTRYIPKEATEIQHPQGLGIVYAYSVNGRPMGIAYAGKANKSSWHHSFIGRDPEAMRQQRIDEFFSGLTSHAQYKAKAKEERRQPNTFAVGDIVRNSWGYDQTNVDFYEVVKRTDYFVWLQPLKQRTEETGFMCGPTVPVPGTAHGKLTKHGANAFGIGFKYGGGGKWDGKPERSSWYA